MKLKLGEIKEEIIGLRKVYDKKLPDLLCSEFHITGLLANA